MTQFMRRGLIHQARQIGFDKPNPYIVFMILFIFCLMSFSAFAAKKGFVESKQEKLTQQVHKKYKTAEILKKISELRSYDAWPQNMNPVLKLYVASKWIEQNHMKEAYDVLHSIDPGQVDLDLWQFYRATTLLNLGRLNEFKSLYWALSKKYPADVDLLFLKSSYQAHNRDYIGSTQTLTEVIEKTRRNGKAYLQRGLVYLLSLSHELAFEDLKKAARYLDKENVYYRQMAYLQMGLIQLKYYQDNEKAEKIFEKGIKLSPDSILVKELKQKVAY